jgi:hypothetical protein
MNYYSRMPVALVLIAFALSCTISAAQSPTSQFISSIKVQAPKVRGECLGDDREEIRALLTEAFSGYAGVSSGTVYVMAFQTASTVS